MLTNLRANLRDLAHATVDELLVHLFPGAAPVPDAAPESATRRCRRGERCEAAERRNPQDKVSSLVGAPSDRPLCGTCERAVAQALADVRQLYLDLEDAMRPDATGPAASGRITSRSTGSPMQVNGRALHLQETVHQLLTVWEDAVRDTARLSMVSRRPLDPWERSKGAARAGGETVRAATLLAAHLTAWIVHQPIEYAITRSTADPDDPRADPDMDSSVTVSQAGWEAAAALIDWKQHARAALGVTNPPIKRSEPCMYCEVRAIVEVNGADEIRCENCRHHWTREEYAGKVRGFEPYLRTLARRAKTPIPQDR